MNLSGLLSHMDKMMKTQTVTVPLPSYNRRKPVFAVFHTFTPPSDVEKQVLTAIASNWAPRVHQIVIDEHAMALEILLEADERTPQAKRALRERASVQFKALLAWELDVVAKLDALKKDFSQVVAPFIGASNPVETQREIRHTLASLSARQVTQELDRHFQESLSKIALKPNLGNTKASWDLSVPPDASRLFTDYYVKT